MAEENKDKLPRWRQVMVDLHGWDTTEGKYCGAKKRDKSGDFCRLPAGFGTEHPGWGRCKYHGGCNTGPKTPEGKRRSSMNALKHGAAEVIWLDTLTETERELIKEIETDIKPQIDREIRLLEIRERRMLQRIQRYRSEADLIKVGEEITDGISDKDGRKSETKTLYESKMDIVLKMEETLTRVQNQKRSMLELKQRVEETTTGEEGVDNLEGLSNIIDQSAKMLKGTINKDKGQGSYGTD